MSTKVVLVVNNCICAPKVLLINGKAYKIYKSEFQKNIIKNQFAIENEDYTELVLSTRSKDFALTLDFSKKICMLARTKKGEEIRNYFIEVEKKSKSLVKIVTPAEQLLQNAQLLVQQEKKIIEHDQRLNKLEAERITRPEYFTVAGFGTIIGTPVNTTMASRLGRAAARLCKQKNLPIDKVKDTRWGLVNSYPKPILEEVFNTDL